MKWFSKNKDKLPENGDERVIVFSPIYPIGHNMKFRIIQAQFIKICTNVTQWAYISELEKEIK